MCTRVAPSHSHYYIIQLLPFLASCLLVVLRAVAILLASASLVVAADLAAVVALSSSGVALALARRLPKVPRRM